MSCYDIMFTIIFVYIFLTSNALVNRPSSELKTSYHLNQCGPAWQLGVFSSERKHLVITDYRMTVSQALMFLTVSSCRTVTSEHPNFSLLQAIKIPPPFAPVSHTNTNVGCLPLIGHKPSMEKSMQSACSDPFFGVPPVGDTLKQPVIWDSSALLSCGELDALHGSVSWSFSDPLCSFTDEILSH